MVEIGIGTLKESCYDTMICIVFIVELHTNTPTCLGELKDGNGTLLEGGLWRTGKSDLGSYLHISRLDGSVGCLDVGLPLGEVDWSSIRSLYPNNNIR